MRQGDHISRIGMIPFGALILASMLCGFAANAQIPGTNPSVLQGQGHDWGIGNEDLSDIELSEVKAAYRKGLRYLKEGSCRKAEAKLEFVLSIVKDDASVYYLAATADRCQGKFKSAASNYESAIEYDPSMYLAYKNLGVCYLALGDAEMAIEQLATLETLRIDCAEECSSELEEAHADLGSAIEAARKH